MILRILIIPDKFKGTLSARAAAEAIAQGWRRARPGDQLTLLPMSDGGEGFGEVMSGFEGARRLSIKTLDAAHRPCCSTWWWQAKTKTAIIETARVIGLAMLPPKRFHPFELDTFGLGAVFKSAARKGATHCIVGIGGSATNDGGFGLGRAIGWTFFDGAGTKLQSWQHLKRLEHICPPRNKFAFKEVRVAVDVRNPLIGRRGASRIYGPQKGLRPEDFRLAESCLARLSDVWKKQFCSDLSRTPGAGAAGGLGFGLMAFLEGDLKPGFELFAQRSKLKNFIRATDLVITGEGAVDESTLMGKGVGQLASFCRELKVPCLAMAGLMSGSDRVKNRFTQTYSLTTEASPKEATVRAGPLLVKLAAQAALNWTSSLAPSGGER